MRKALSLHRKRGDSISLYNSAIIESFDQEVLDELLAFEDRLGVDTTNHSEFALLLFIHNCTIE